MDLEPAGGPGPTADDLTARARIRDAALRHLAEQGFARTTVRGVARTAGVSLGLVRHHFGSKEGLRQACDAHVLAVMRAINDQSRRDAEQGDLGASAAARRLAEPYQRYVARSLVDGSPGAAALFDELIAMTEPWFDLLDADRADPSPVPRRTRAAVVTAMALGIPLLHDHLSRALGVDTFSPDGDREVALAALDLWSHPLVGPDLAARAADALRAAGHAGPTRATTEEQA